jgi:hypothetical protein
MPCTTNSETLDQQQIARNFGAYARAELVAEGELSQELKACLTAPRAFFIMGKLRSGKGRNKPFDLWQDRAF